MSLWAEYFREREDMHCIEVDGGFASYLLNGQDCYLRDIYVKPGLRKSGLAKRLAQQVESIAKEKGCKYLIGTVCPQANGATDSLKVLLAYDMKLAGASETLITFEKEL